MNTKLLAILACLLWGSAFAGAKIGFTYTTPIHLSGMRFMLAGILLIPLLIYQKVDWKKTIKEWRYMLLFGLLQTFLQYGLFFMGLNKLPASVAAIIIGAGPLFVAIMAHLSISTDKLTPRKMLAIALGLTGVVFISVSKGSFAGGDNMQFYLGVFLLIISNIIGGATNIIVAKSKKDISPVALTAVANFSGGLLLYVVSFFTEDYTIKPYTGEFYLALLWLAFIPAAGFSIWFTLLKRPGVKVSDLNMWKFIVPVTGVVLSWILLDNEHPDSYSVIGIIIITTALLILQSKQRQTSVPATGKKAAD